MINLLTKLVRRYFIGKDFDFTFKKTDKPQLDNINNINLYIHIPFCKNFCPYCPYNKINYDEKLITPYINALYNEIDLYYKILGKIKVSSIYIGGGTPTLIIDEVIKVINYLKNKFTITGDICIETNPDGINDYIIEKLKKNNFNLISVGVQSFNEKHFQFIGRNYQDNNIINKINKLVENNFKSINLDLIFAIPNQSIIELKNDLDTAIKLNVNQITTYPLFTFPYSSVGKYLKLKNVKMPNLIKRHKFYDFIHEYLEKNNYKRVSVWSFKKDKTPRYSSVTRDNYLGLGAGAGSHLPGGFYVNTFSVENYINKCLNKKFPVALYLPFNLKFNNYFWLYWRFYDTLIPKNELEKHFGKNNKKINMLFNILNKLGYINIENKVISLNKKGAFWIHLAQNYFSLKYINKIWSVLMKEPFPDRIKI